MLASRLSVEHTVYWTACKIKSLRQDIALPKAQIAVKQSYLSVFGHAGQDKSAVNFYNIARDISAASEQR